MKTSIPVMVLAGWLNQSAIVSAPPEPRPLQPGQERHESCKPTEISQKCPIGSVIKIGHLAACQCTAESHMTLVHHASEQMTVTSYADELSTSL